MASNIKLEVSLPTFNEIAGLLEAAGVDLKNIPTITLDKTTSLVRPVDMRLVTIRRDCVIEAAKIFKSGDGSIDNFIEYADRIYQYVLNNKGNEPKETKNPTTAAVNAGWGVPIKE